MLQSFPSFQEFSGKGKKKIPTIEKGLFRPFSKKQTNSFLYFLSSLLTIHPSDRSIEFKTSNAEQALAFEHFETNFRIESRKALWRRIQSGSEPLSKPLPFIRQTFPFAPVFPNSDVAFSLHFAKPGDCIFRQESID